MSLHHSLTALMLLLKVEARTPGERRTLSLSKFCRKWVRSLISAKMSSRRDAMKLRLRLTSVNVKSKLVLLKKRKKERPRRKPSSSKKRARESRKTELMVSNKRLMSRSLTLQSKLLVQLSRSTARRISLMP